MRGVPLLLSSVCPVTNHIRAVISPVSRNRPNLLDLRAVTRPGALEYGKESFIQPAAVGILALRKLGDVAGRGYEGADVLPSLLGEHWGPLCAVQTGETREVNECDRYALRKLCCW